MMNGDDEAKARAQEGLQASRSEWLDLPASESPRLEPPSAVVAPDRSRLIRGGKLVGSTNTTPIAVEQYRRLAAVMHQAQVDRGIKTMMVASAYSGEGKTLTAANLALTLSESYRRRVLLIDADLRRPSLHSVFGLPNLEGLSDGLKSKTVRRMPLVEVTPNLCLVPGGRPDPDPMGSLTSERMKHVLAQSRERFDWVILDSPPIVLLPDGSLVAAMVETVLLVIAAGRTPYAAIQRAVDAVGRERIIGTVLNFVDQAGIAPAIQAYDYYRRPYVATAGALERAR